MVLCCGLAAPASGPCRGCVQPNICRTSCPGPHCSNPLRIRRGGSDRRHPATQRRHVQGALMASGKGAGPGRPPIRSGLPRIRLRRSRAAPGRRRRSGIYSLCSGFRHHAASHIRHHFRFRAYPQPGHGAPPPGSDRRRPRACRRPSGPSSRPMPTATASNRRWRGSPRRRGWRCWTWTRRCAAARPAGAVRSCCWRVSSSPPTWTSSTAIT